MIRVSVKRLSDIQEIVIKGHAESGPHGQDLVCAGVSSIVFGMMNALDSLTKGACDFEITKSQIHIQNIQENASANMLMEAMLLQLKTLEKSYKNNIKINDQEV